MAGGLDPALAPGTVFLPVEVMSTEGDAVTTDSRWRERLSEAIKARAPVAHGKLLTSRKAIGSQADKANLFRQTGAAAVDMESLAIAQIARAHQIPFIAVRVIVDSAEDALPRAVTAAADAEGHLQVWKLMGELVRAPAELAPLLRLAQRYRAANRSLAAVASTGSLAGSLS
jgi:adenosylhomocysteine nucleosidase